MRSVYNNVITVEEKDIEKQERRPRLELVWWEIEWDNLTRC